MKEKTMSDKKLPGNPNKQNLIIGVLVLAVGSIVMIAGLVVLLVNLLTATRLRDAEYLVEIGTWEKDGEPAVIWEFTEIGKGTLTTNDHENDYDFIWAIDGDKLKIETDWLYTLNDEFEYTLDQDNQTLTLDGNINFRAASGVDAEV